MQVTMTVNGEQVTAEVEPRMLLVHFLRDHLRLTGTHWGCDTSNCGTCVVDVDGEPVKSCTILAAMASGHSVRTVEGMEIDGTLDPVQEGFMQCHGLQCGFCTPGMMITARALLDRNPDPTRTRSARPSPARSAGAPATPPSCAPCSGRPGTRTAASSNRAKRRRLRTRGADRRHHGARRRRAHYRDRELVMTTVETSRTIWLDNDQKPCGHGRMLRKEDPRFIRGRGNYVDDISLPGMLHLAILRSPYAHARINSIDVICGPSTSEGQGRRHRGRSRREGPGVDADAVQRRAGRPRHRQGAVPGPGGGLRRRRGSLLGARRAGAHRCRLRARLPR